MCIITSARVARSCFTQFGTRDIRHDPSSQRAIIAAAHNFIKAFMAYGNTNGQYPPIDTSERNPPSSGPKMDPALKAAGRSSMPRDSNFAPLITRILLRKTAFLPADRPPKSCHAIAPAKLRAQDNDFLVSDARVIGQDSPHRRDEELRDSAD
ncbi:hypothetical protein BTUL_0201g00050 [Botrytis tulipae]|uniref:Uncharacterized protein n=1 Tax=Botrytis tulipae TaxID=87230 RepID=A0A4Z1EGY0_9HELO|nr:hypothetical protein BTUL_0201g00050 [Botrytis tulipae]